MRKVFLMFLFLLLVNFVSCACTEGQIDINSASKEDLDLLYGIGPAKAESVINARPFGSVDGLINVSGIGEVTLEKIKEQGLACVSAEDEENNINSDKEENNNIATNEDNEDEENEKETESENNAKVYSPKNEVTSFSVKEIDTTPVSLNPKDIKTKSSPESTGSEVYPKYLLGVFCILLLLLYLIKPRNKKNEFGK